MAEMCEICGTGPYGNMPGHVRGKAHKRALAKVMKAGQETPNTPPAAPSLLDPDLQSIIDRTNESPQQRARATRVSFGVRGWPNAEHPGTVRDFLEEHDIPCL